MTVSAPFTKLKVEQTSEYSKFKGDDLSWDVDENGFLNIYDTIPGTGNYNTKSLRKIATLRDWIEVKAVAPKA